MPDKKADWLPMRLGHVALRVRDLDRAVAFYRDVLGLELVGRGANGPAFLKLSPDKSHDIALMQLPAEAAGPDPGRVGMYHIAWEMASFEALSALHDRLIANGVRIAGYSPGGNSANVMFFDPEGNELEAIWEPSKEEIERYKTAGGAVPKLTPAVTA
jgi:catechol-2,3-dioxygenase